MIHYFRRMFEYDAWANTLVFSSIREQGDAGPDARRLFAHILAAELIWMSRVLEEPAPMQPWTEMTMDQCGRYVRDLPKRWSDLLGELSDEDLEDGRHYSNTQGQAFTTKVRDMLQQVVTHSAYHRGQIARLVREVGLTPAVTDYIAFDRTHS